MGKFNLDGSQDMAKNKRRAIKIINEIGSLTSLCQALNNKL
jgi:hypothetical protein